MLITQDPWSVANLDWAQAISEQLGPRRTRLFMSACCREFFKGEVPPSAAAELEVFDRFADTGKSKTLVREAKTRVSMIPRQGTNVGPGKFARSLANLQFAAIDV